MSVRQLAFALVATAFCGCAPPNVEVDVPALPNTCSRSVLAAIDRGDYAAFKDLAARGAVIQCPDTYAQLARAVAERRTDVVESLLSLGLPPTCALNAAIADDNVDLLTSFLERDANPNGGSCGGEFAFPYSLQVAFDRRGGRGPESARLVLAHGANPNQDGSYEWDELGRPALFGATALIAAAAAGDAAFVALLLDFNANISARDRAGRSALDYATERGHAEIVTLLAARSR